MNEFVITVLGAFIGCSIVSFIFRAINNHRKLNKLEERVIDLEFALMKIQAKSTECLHEFSLCCYYHGEPDNNYRCKKCGIKENKS